MGKWVFAIVIAVTLGIIGISIFAPMKDVMVGVQNIEQTVDNYSFEITDPPASWTSAGAGATFSRSATQAKVGTYSGKIVRSGADAYYYQNYGTRFNDKTVTFGCWAWASVANRAHIVISDGVSTSTSLEHSGSSTWEWLTVSHTVSPTASYCYIMVYNHTADTTVYFDGAEFYQGGDIPAVPDSVLLRSFRAGLPYAMIFFVGFAIYLGFKRNKG